MGNVVIGRRDEDDDTAKTESGREERREGYRDDEVEEDGISDGVELVGEGVKGDGVGGGAER